MTRAIALIMRASSVWIVMMGVMLLLVPTSVRAQTADIDWEDAGVTSLTPFPSGTTVSGSDGTTATVTWSTETVGGGSFQPAFGGDFVSYFGGSVGGNPSPLLVSFDNSAFDPRDRITLTITLSRTVRDLRFALSDIDNGNFADAVEVYYDGDLTGGFTNARTNSGFWTAGASATETNDATVNGWRGTSNSTTGSADGNIDFDFGNTDVRRIQIVYFSYTGSGDPGTQFATVSDLEFAQETADLSLAKQLIGAAPANGGTATWRLTVTNASSSLGTANGVVVRDDLPAEFVFESASGTGTFDPVNGDWSVGSLAPGASASIDITGTIGATAGATISNTAEIISSSLFDPDSTPDNGANSEDDFAESNFIVDVSPGGPPILSCPAGTSVFDWDTVSWPRGSLSNSYQLASLGTIDFDIVTNGTFVSRGSFGGAVPGLTNAVQGGLNPAEQALAFNQNNTNSAQQAVTTITLPQVFIGAQFTVFDIDRSSTFQDRITVYGLLNGVRVNPVLTSSSANTVVGDSIIGTSGASDNLGIANGTITFLGSIDTIVIEYGNGPNAPANPTNQSVAIHDFTLCNPALPDISVTKVSSVISDPVNGVTNPKAIPGATVEYLISVSNIGAGPTDADSVVVTDNGPADAKLCLIARSGGPVIFADPGSNSGLSYSFLSLATASDGLEFSNDDGATWDYEPSADPDGCDSAVTDFRVLPDGAFAGGGDFTLRVRYQVQ